MNPTVMRRVIASSLVSAGVMLVTAVGATTITVERGYGNLVDRLRALGAQVSKVE
mgnify:CR=1 FL=1